MITNFEDHTEDLTELEKKYLPDVRKALEWILYRDIGKFPRPIKQPLVVKEVNTHLIAKHGLFCELRLNTVRLRKYFNYFRTNGVLPIIATSDGCYITQDKEEISKQIKSMEQRSRQIMRAADGMKNFL